LNVAGLIYEKTIVMDDDKLKRSLLEEYTELTKNSLVKIQFSCGGNSTGIDEPEPIPIVPESYIPEGCITYAMASEDHVEDIITLLKTNNLPVKDLSNGRRIFFVALSNQNTVGCVAIELYGDSGLLRSLAVELSFRERGVGHKLMVEAENWCHNNGLNILYLLTTTASAFFSKIGWESYEREAVPESIAQSPEFASVCPTTAVCMFKKIY